MSIKNEILKNICYTKLVYGRINKKLGSVFSNKQIEEYILKIIYDTEERFISKIGKNYYITNHELQVRITINSYSYRIITIDKINNKPHLTKIVDSNTRFYIDINKKTRLVIGWGFGQRQELLQVLKNPSHRRVFITKGQYNKLEENR